MLARVKTIADEILLVAVAGDLIARVLVDLTCLGHCCVNLSHKLKQGPTCCVRKTKPIILTDYHEYQAELNNYIKKISISYYQVHSILKNYDLLKHTYYIRTYVKRMIVAIRKLRRCN